jgi:hypothetical protein
MRTLEPIRTVRDDVAAITKPGSALPHHPPGASGTDVFDYLEFLEPRSFNGCSKAAGRCACISTTASPLLQSAARQPLRSRLLPERSDLGIADGGRTRRRWPPKHDNIPVYVKDPRHYAFDADGADRIPYMAPGLVGPDKAAPGKRPTDAWWHTIVPPAADPWYPTRSRSASLRRIRTLPTWRPGSRFRRQRHRRRAPTNPAATSCLSTTARKPRA